MLRIGVCEDDSKYRESLAFLLEKYLHHRENDLIIEEFSTGDALLQWLEKHQGELDICFLDIEMPGKNGMETARNIRKKDARMLLVFLTGYREYVFDGYEVDALDYLLKPVRERKLQEVLDRARKLLSRKERDRFTFRNKEGIYRIPKNHILYFYSDFCKCIWVLWEDGTGGRTGGRGVCKDSSALSGQSPGGAESREKPGFCAG